MINIGSNTVTNIYIGSTAPDAIYVGTVKIFPIDSGVGAAPVLRATTRFNTLQLLEWTYSGAPSGYIHISYTLERKRGSADWKNTGIALNQNNRNWAVNDNIVGDKYRIRAGLRGVGQPNNFSPWSNEVTSGG